MQLVEATLDSMDFKDDVAVVLDMALGSILGTLSSGTPEVRCLQPQKQRSPYICHPRLAILR